MGDWSVNKKGDIYWIYGGHSTAEFEDVFELMINDKTGHIIYAKINEINQFNYNYWKYLNSVKLPSKTWPKFSKWEKIFDKLNDDLIIDDHIVAPKNFKEIDHMPEKAGIILTIMINHYNRGASLTNSLNGETFKIKYVPTPKLNEKIINKENILFNEYRAWTNFKAPNRYYEKKSACIIL